MQNNNHVTAGEIVRIIQGRESHSPCIGKTGVIVSVDPTMLRFPVRVILDDVMPSGNYFDCNFAYSELQSIKR